MPLTAASVVWTLTRMILPLTFACMLQVFPDGGRTLAVEGSQFMVPILAVVQPNWRPWEEAGESRFHRKIPAKRASQTPSATVEVVGDTRDLAERLMEFRARVAPELRLAYDLGFSTRTNVQMLSEFMQMDPSHPHPPTIPSVYYNNFQPPPENPALVEMKR